MIDLNPIRHEEDVLRDDMKLDLARKVLETALNVVDSRLDPRSEERAEVERRLMERKEADRRRENCRKVLNCIFAIAALGAFIAALCSGIREFKEEEAAIADADQKDLYRKLSTIKGRTN